MYMLVCIERGCFIQYFVFSILYQSNSFKCMKVSGLDWRSRQLSFELKQCTVPISDVSIIIWIQRHCSEQDGHDEQVVLVKQMCKYETIAFRVTVCLWISRVIVPLQLGYLHNQLSGLAIMYVPLFAQCFRCSWLNALYSRSLFLCVSTECMHLYVLMHIDEEQRDNTLHLDQFTTVEGHRSLFTMFTLRHVYVLYLVCTFAAQNNKHWIYL